jgi:predicted Ser/Thr protein kinase
MPPLPSHVGRYQVRSCIGQGGMGVLYLAFDPLIGRQVAVKLLRIHSEEYLERFAREARSAGRLQHPNIVTIYDVGEFEGQPFIAMEYIAGQTLAELIARRVPLPLLRRLELVEELCDGLAYAHRAGIVHRDIKPANLMVNDEGLLKILDFGIARLADAGVTRVGLVVGTPNYMSPEQVQGLPLDHRSDIFAVGLVVYELLSGRQAFTGDSPIAVAQRVVNEQPVPLTSIVPDLDPAVARIVARAIEKDPAARYQDLAVMRREVARVRAQLDQESLDATIVAPTPVVRQPGMPTPPRQPATHTPPRRPADMQELAQRRQAQIEQHLHRAEEALAGGHLEDALREAEQAAFLDPSYARTLECLDRVRAATDARQVEEWLDAAEQHLVRGALTDAQALVDQARQLDPESEHAAALAAAIATGRREREARLARARQLEDRLARAGAALDAGRFEAARGLLEDAAGIEGLETGQIQQIEAAQLVLAEREAETRRRETRQALLAEARERLAAGDFARALACVEGARELDPMSEVVAALAADIERAKAAAEERRREEEIEQRVRAAVASARAEAAEGRHEQALRALRALPGAHRLVVETIEELERGREAAIRRQREEEERRRREALLKAATEAVEAARAETAAGRHREAIARLEAFRPGHPLIIQALGELRLELARVEAARREEEIRVRQQRVQALVAEAEAALAAGRFDEAEAQVNEALTLDLTSKTAQALRVEVTRARHAFEVRQRAERHAEAARAAVAQARERFDAGDRDGAIRALHAFTPSHPLADEALASLEAEREAIRRAEAEAEAARLAIERRALDVVEQARREFAAGRHADALDRLARFEPPHERVMAEHAHLRARLEAIEAERRREEEERLQEIQSALADATAHFERGELSLARKYVDTVLSLDPAHEAARALKDQVGRAIEAERRRRDAEREAERRQEAMRAGLETARTAASHDRAIEALQKVLALDPGHGEARRLLGERTEARAREEAERTAEEAVAAALTRARFLVDVGRTQEAERQLADTEAAYAGAPALERAQRDFAALRARMAAPAPVEASGPARPADTLDDTAKVPADTLRMLAQVASPQPPAPQPPPPAARPAVVSPARPQSVPAGTLRSAGPGVERALRRPPGLAWPAARPTNAVLAAVGAAVLLATLIAWALWPSSAATGPGAQTPEAVPAEASGTTTPETETSTPGGTVPAGTTPPAETASGAPADAGERPGPEKAAGPGATPSAVAAALADARRLRTQGRDEAALRAALAGLDPGSPAPDLLALINAVVASAAERAATGRTAAEAARAQDTAAYREGQTAERQASALRRASRHEDAYRMYVTAAERFGRARDEAARAVSPPPPPTQEGRPSEPATSFGAGNPRPPDAPPRSTTESPARQQEPPPRTDTPPAREPPAQAPVDVRPSVLALLRFYADAYRSFDLRSLRAVYPSLPDYRERGLEENRRACASLEVTFGDLEWVRVEPTRVEVRTSTTYDCRTRTGQRVPQTVREAFIVSLRGDRWQIDSMGTFER